MIDGKYYSRLIAAFVMAYHTGNEKQPAFEDKVARYLFTDDEYEQVKQYILAGADFFMSGRERAQYSDESLLRIIINEQFAPIPLAGARYCDDCIRKAIMTGIDQYVAIGAEYDTFVWREPELSERMTVFEVDDESLIEDKRMRIERAGLQIPNNLHMVAADLSKGDLAEKLLAAGYDTSKKALFSMLGVTYYLNAQSVREIFSNIDVLSREGNVVIFDFAEREIVDSRIDRVRNLLAMASASGESIKFTSSAKFIEHILQNYHLVVEEHYTSDEIDRMYLKKTALTAFEHINYMTFTNRERQKTATKERILQVALKLFAKRGYDSVSVRDISGELGISQTALYKHYLNKRDIFISILNRMEENDPLCNAYGAHNEVDHDDIIKLSTNPEGSGVNIGSGERRRDDISQTITYLKRWIITMFRFWTEDEFASLFRKLITIEQHRNEEMAKLYDKYLLHGPLNHIQEAIKGANIDSFRFAVDMYSPVYMMMAIYDEAGDDLIAAKKVFDLLTRHVETFGITE